MVAKLLDAKADMAAVVPQGQYDVFGVTGGTTALGLACQLASPAVVDNFLERRADINTACDGLQATPLMKAANCGNVDTLNLLITNKADVEARDMFGLVPLQAAIEGNFMASVTALLAAKANPRKSTYFGSDTVAFVSTFRGDTSMMQTILENRGDPNIQDPCQGDEILKLIHMARDLYKSGEPLTEALSLWA